MEAVNHSLPKRIADDWDRLQKLQAEMTKAGSDRRITLRDLIFLLERESTAGSSRLLARSYLKLR